jgi:5-formyltetrahydrofolate cyclo-ligase
VRMPTDKAAWRRRLRAAREALPPDRLAAAAEALRHLLLPRLAGFHRVAAYVPVGAEPGSLDLLDGLLARGTAVLLPVVHDAVELNWAEYAGRDQLAPGARGTRQPTARPLGAAALARADVVLVPALAADYAGIRLGRGAGYYDRALAAIANDVPVVALLHDGELVPQLPSDPWDRPVTAISSPALGWTELPFVAHHVT